MPWIISSRTHPIAWYRTHFSNSTSGGRRSYTLGGNPPGSFLRTPRAFPCPYGLNRPANKLELQQLQRGVDDLWLTRVFLRLRWVSSPVWNKEVVKMSRSN